MSKMSQSTINVKELKTVLHHIIETNKQLQSKGQVPVAINVTGPAGLGKTSTIRQAGIEAGFKPENVELLNLSALEEIGDLIGIPVTEYKMLRQVDQEGKTITQGKWVSETALSSYERSGWVATTESRMSYAPPSWVQGKTGPGILILDDYTRASQRFTQAVMQLILEQAYASWALPQGWTIILSSNPDDGMYNVTDQDPAQKSRYLNVQLGWDAEIWAEWAEKHGVDGRCINFILMNPEIIKDENPEINARSITLYFNSISSIPVFENNLELIQLLGEGSLGPEVTATFAAFINHKMDKLITTKEILDIKTPFKDVEAKIVDIVKKGPDYRADIAFVLTTRLLNYIQFTMSNDEITPDVIKRLEDLITANVLGSDLKFVMGRKLTNLPHLPNLNPLICNDAVIDNILE
jgi:hypothetical protein